MWHVRSRAYVPHRILAIGRDRSNKLVKIDKSTRARTHTGNEANINTRNGRRSESQNDDANETQNEHQQTSTTYRFLRAREKQKKKTFE